MSRLINICFLWVLVCCSSAANSYQGQPWLVESSSFAMISFSVDPDVIQTFLPPELKPHLNGENRVPLILEVYSTEKIAGIPAYKTAFIVVEVAGYPSRTGTPGHFAIWGRVDSPASRDFFSSLGFPYSLATTMDIRTADQQTFIADVSGGLLNFQLDPSRDAPFVGQGTVDMLVFNNQKLMKSEVSYLTQGVFAKVTSFKVLANNDPVLNLLKSAVPDWALVSDKQIFSYSHLVPVNKIEAQ
jgi:hypothetical protein